MVRSIYFMVLLLSACLSSAIVFAQSRTYSVITITVKQDGNGTNIPNAEVIITDTVSKYELVVKADSSGFVRVRLLRGHVFEIYSYVPAADDPEGPIYLMSKPYQFRTDSEEQKVILENPIMHFSRGCWTPPSIYFAKNSAKLSVAMKADLDSFMVFISKFKLLFEVAGYTDIGGDPEKNFLLSLQRAEAVKAYLESCRDTYNNHCQFVVIGYGSFRTTHDCNGKCYKENHRGKDRVGLRLAKNLAK